MCLLFESIRVEEHQFIKLGAHLDRMNVSRAELFGDQLKFHASSFLIPDDVTDRMYKCRIIYDRLVRQIEFTPYKKRKIKRVKVVIANDLEYSYKFLDRTAFTTIQRKYPDYDEFIMVKNGCITDSTFSNLAFFDGRQWITPCTYLLNGTRRQDLIRNGIITESEIRSNDIHKFNKVSFINAMLDLDELSLEINNLKL